MFAMDTLCRLSAVFFLTFSGHNSHDNRNNVVIEFCHRMKPKIPFNSNLHFRGEEIIGQRCEGAVICDACAILKEFNICSLFFFLKI